MELPSYKIRVWQLSLCPWQACVISFIWKSSGDVNITSSVFSQSGQWNSCSRQCQSKAERSTLPLLRHVCSAGRPEVVLGTLHPQRRPPTKSQGCVTVCLHDTSLVMNPLRPRVDSTYKKDTPCSCGPDGLRFTTTQREERAEVKYTRKSAVLPERSAWGHSNSPAQFPECPSCIAMAT